MRLNRQAYLGCNRVASTMARGPKKKEKIPDIITYFAGVSDQSNESSETNLNIFVCGDLFGIYQQLMNKTSPQFWGYQNFVDKSLPQLTGTILGYTQTHSSDDSQTPRFNLIIFSIGRLLGWKIMDFKIPKFTKLESSFQSKSFCTLR